MKSVELSIPIPKEPIAKEKTDYTSLKRLFQKSIGLLVLASLWEIMPRIGAIDSRLMPPLSKVLLTFFNLIVSGELTRHILISGERMLTGFGLALVVNIPLGLALSWYKGLERIIDPVLQVFRQTSGLALFPLFILFFGIGEVSKIAIITYACQWPILLNTISGVKGIDPIWIKSARSMGASNFELFYKIVLPATIPSIATGARLGASMAVVLLVGAEMIGASSGLGFLVLDTQYKFQLPKMYASILTIIIIGLCINYIFVWLERKLTVWKERMISETE
jgi:NitT/TauT family transport system permease protein